MHESAFNMILNVTLSQQSHLAPLIIPTQKNIFNCTSLIILFHRMACKYASRRTSRSKHSLLLRDTKRGAARWRSLFFWWQWWRHSSNWSELLKTWLVEVTGAGLCESNRDTLQFVLPPNPSYRDVGEPAAAAAPHAQVLPEQLVHPFLTVPFAGRFPDTYEPTISLL